MTAYFPLLIWFYILAFVFGYRSMNKAMPEYVVDGTGDRYLITMSDVEYDTTRYAFATVPDRKKAEHSEYMSGLGPIVTFTLTNESNERKLMPVPNYFYISSDFYEGHEVAHVFYDERCKCYISEHADEPEVLDSGFYARVQDVATQKIGDKYALEFGPWETKEFTVQFFEGMFPENEERFRFCGFTHTDKRTGKREDIAFEIDVPSGKVKKTTYIR